MQRVLVLLRPLTKERTGSCSDRWWSQPSPCQPRQSLPLLAPPQRSKQSLVPQAALSRKQQRSALVPFLHQRVRVALPQDYATRTSLLVVAGPTVILRMSGVGNRAIQILGLGTGTGEALFLLLLQGGMARLRGQSACTLICMRPRRLGDIATVTVTMHIGRLTLLFALPITDFSRTRHVSKSEPLYPPTT